MSNSNILVVEDDFAIRNLITTALEMENYKYRIAKSGDQAIIEAATQYPELILLDLGLPDMDGVDVIKKIRSSDSGKKLRCRKWFCNIVICPCIQSINLIFIITSCTNYNNWDG